MLENDSHGSRFGMLWFAPKLKELCDRGLREVKLVDLDGCAPGDEVDLVCGTWESDLLGAGGPGSLPNFGNSKEKLTSCGLLTTLPDASLKYAGIVGAAGFQIGRAHV